MRGGAILLTDGSTQAPETAAYLAAHPNDIRYAIGGPLATFGADPVATPVYGQDLYGSSAAVAMTFFPNATTFDAATGLNFPDALAGGLFMGTPGHVGPMLLVEPSVPLPPNIANYLVGDGQMSKGYLFGGPLAVGSDVMAALLEVRTSAIQQDWPGAARHPAALILTRVLSGSQSRLAAVTMAPRLTPPAIGDKGSANPVASAKDV